MDQWLQQWPPSVLATDPYIVLLTATMLYISPYIAVSPSQKLGTVYGTGDLQWIPYGITESIEHPKVILTTF